MKKGATPQNNYVIMNFALWIAVTVTDEVWHLFRGVWHLCGTCRCHAFCPFAASERGCGTCGTFLLLLRTREKRKKKREYIRK